MAEVVSTGVSHMCDNTVEPPNKEHFGNRPVVLCSEVVPISEVHQIFIIFLCLKIFRYS